METPVAAIERLIAQDPGQRNIAGLVQPDHLRQAALALSSAKKVAIVSGFFVPAAQAGETDGPPGAKALGDALLALGIPVDYVTDAANLPLFQAQGAEPLYVYHPALLEELDPSNLIAVERLGRARDGRYYNMRGEDLTPHTAPLDEMFIGAEQFGILTIGIGDGGNEIGMGRVIDEVTRSVACGDRIASTVVTDYLIVAGISNWGAYGLAGALSLAKNRDLLPTARAARRCVMDLVDAGAVDGVTLKFGATVDGLPLDHSLDLLEQIRRYVSDATG